MKRTIGLFCFVFLLIAAVSFVARPIVRAQDDTGEIKMINGSGHYLTLYVDEVPNGACPSGDSVVTTASVGAHNLRVSDGEASLTTSINLTTAGFVWNITNSGN
jgi:hypothetical protein